MAQGHFTPSGSGCLRLVAEIVGLVESATLEHRESIAKHLLEQVKASRQYFSGGNCLNRRGRPLHQIGFGPSACRDTRTHLCAGAH